MADHEQQKTRELLSPAELASLAGLALTTRNRVAGAYVGRHRASGPGQSTEFHDFRSYAPGDEPRRVDWKLYGRTDRLFVRQYRHDAALRVHVIVDRSASMDYADPQGGRQAMSKWAFGQQLAAAIGWLATRQQDRVRLTLIGRDAEAAVPEGGTAAHLRRMLDVLAEARCEGASDPGAAMASAAGLAAGGSRGSGVGLTVVISDLLDATGPWLNGLAGLARGGGELLVLQVLTPSELHPGRLRAGRLVDPETGRAVRADPASTAGAYEYQMRRYLERLRTALASWGAEHALMRTDRPAVEALRGVLGRRSGWGQAGAG